MKKIWMTFLTTIIALNVFSQDAVVFTPLMEKVDCAEICQEKLDSIFQALKKSAAFDWTDEKNNCEDRANAVSLILDSWEIPNGKSWMFSGQTFDENVFNGTLGGYSYHVAGTILIRNAEGGCDTMIIDPLMNNQKALPLQEWVHALTRTQGNVYVLTRNDHYQQTEVSAHLIWKPRAQYFQQTLEGLTRYNDYSWKTRLMTKKYLKRRLSTVTTAFNLLLNHIPDVVSSVQCNQ